MSRRLLVLIAVLVTAALGGDVHTASPGLAIQEAGGSARLRFWFALARNHKPGEIDQSIEIVRSLSTDALCQIQEDFAVVLRYLQEWNQPNGSRNTVPRAAREKELFALADETTSGGKDFSLLKRLALLHADAVVLSGGQPYDTSPKPSCFAKSAATMAVDGVRLGDVTTTPHWVIARTALRAASSGEKEADPWIRQWYRATTAWLFKEQQLASIPDHLAAWKMDAPNDVELAFAQGCLFESYANERIQQVLDSARPGDEYRVPHRHSALEQAKSFFEVSVAQNADDLEARLRLNRTRWLLGDREGLTTGLADRISRVEGDPELQYLGYLFLGAWLQDSNNTEAAATVYAEAARLYPHAQSPAIALAMLRPQATDGFTRLEAVLQIAPSASYDVFSSAQRSADPWFRYHLGPGRRADELLRSLWQATKRD